MFERYPFMVAIIIIWIPVFVMTLLVFYSKPGVVRKPVLNSQFIMRLTSTILFLSSVMIVISGILQLAGVYKVINGRPSTYYHAMFGAIFTAAAINHITIHLRDIIRYLKTKW